MSTLMLSGKSDFFTFYEALTWTSQNQESKIITKARRDAKARKKDSQKRFRVFVLSWLSSCFLPEKAQIP
jgi:hypothetical protein